MNASMNAINIYDITLNITYMTYIQFDELDRFIKDTNNLLNGITSINLRYVTALFELKIIENNILANFNDCI